MSSIVSVIKSLHGVPAPVRPTPGNTAVEGRVYKGATAMLTLNISDVIAIAPDGVRQMLQTMDVTKITATVDVDVQYSSPHPDLVKALLEKKCQMAAFNRDFKVYDSACPHYIINTCANPVCCLQVYEVQIQRVPLVVLFKYNPDDGYDGHQSESRIVRVLSEIDANAEHAHAIQWVKQQVANVMMEEMRIVHEGSVPKENPNSDLLVPHCTRIVDGDSNVLVTYVPSPMVLLPKRVDVTCQLGEDSEGTRAHGSD